MRLSILAGAVLAAMGTVSSVSAQSTVPRQAIAGKQVASNTDGSNVSRVTHPGGSFEYNSGTWIEKDLNGRANFRFEERQRDQWSVYLFDRSRNVNLQLDLHRKLILYSTGNNPVRPLYQITGATARAAPSKPVSSAAGNGRAGGVQVFQHCNFGGYSAGLKPGRYTLSQLAARGIRNDDLSSLRVAPGWRVRIWEHDGFQGNRMSYDSDVPCLTVSNFNDKISSIEVLRTGGGKPSGSTTQTSPAPRGQTNVLKLSQNNMSVTQIEILKNQIKLTGPRTNFIFSNVTDRRASDGNLTATVGLGVINGAPDLGQSFSMTARGQVVTARFASGATLNARVMRPGATTQAAGNKPTQQGGTAAQSGTRAPKARGSVSFQNVDTRSYLSARNGQLSNAGNAADPSAGWMLERVGQERPPKFVRIKTQQGATLYLDQNGPKVGRVDSNSRAGLWVMKKLGSEFTLESAARPGHYLYSVPGSAPAVGPLPYGISASRWSLASPKSNNDRGQGSSQSTSVGSSVALIFQNYSRAPLDVFVTTASGDLGFVQTINPGQELELPAPVGSVWRFAQNDQWAGGVTAGAQARQAVPFGR